MNPSMPHLTDYSHLGIPTRRCRTSWARCLRHEIKVVCDVRSRPGSFRFPQFNREPLEARLTAAKIRYEFCGEQLGGRPLDPQFYLANGLVDYSKRRRAPSFIEAVDKAIALARERKTAILCAEEDPLHCHRFLLICPALVARGVAPVHLRRGGAAETQRDAEDRLLQLHGFADVTSDSLFRAWPGIGAGRCAAIAIGAIRVSHLAGSHRVFLIGQILSRCCVCRSQFAVDCRMM
jgi:Uncharacterized conserved protein